MYCKRFTQILVLLFVVGIRHSSGSMLEKSNVLLQLDKSLLGNRATLYVDGFLMEHNFPSLRDLNITSTQVEAIDGEVSLELEIPVDGLFWLRMDFILDNGAAHLYGEPVSLPIEAGDNFKLAFYERGLVAVGEGSEKVNCLMQLFEQTQIALPERIVELINQKEYMAFAAATNAYVDSIKNSAVESLNAFSSNLNSRAKRCLQEFILGRTALAKISLLKTFRARKIYPLTASELNRLLDTMFSPLKEVQGIEQMPEMHLIKALYELEKEQLRAKRLVDSGSNVLDYDQVYALIDRAFSGAVHDGILLQMLSSDFQMLNRLDQALDYASDTFQDNICQRGLKVLMDKVGKQTEVPDFIFYDTTGKMYEKAFFKSKVLILDFWYTGCGGCAKLFKMSKPLRAYFKNNKSVLFVSINVDYKRERWLSGLRSGLYTDNGHFNLWVGNQGFAHPFLAYYGFNAYPRLLVIDGGGRIVSANPPRPVTNQALEDFIKLVEDAN